MKTERGEEPNQSKTTLNSVLKYSLVSERANSPRVRSVVSMLDSIMVMN